MKAGFPQEQGRSERHYQALKRSRACPKTKTPAGAVFSRSQAEPDRAPCWSRADRAAMSRASVVPAVSTSHFYRSSEDRNVGRCTVFEQPGQSISSALVETSVQRPAEPRVRPAEPRGLEQPFRTPQQSQDGSMSQTLAGAVFSWPDRAS